MRHALNAATEGADLVEAIWEAIPYKDRMRYHEGKKHPTPQAMASAIYDMWDKVDWNEALWNVIENEAEDRLFGAFGNAAKKGRANAHDYTPNTGRGFQSGPWDTPVHPTSNHW